MHPYVAIEAMPMHNPRSTPLADIHARVLEDVNTAIDTLTFGAGRSEAGERAHGKPRFRAILACTDGSRDAEHAIEWTAHLAREHKARAVVASVINPPVIDAGVAGGYAFYPGYTAVHEDLKEVQEKAVANGAQALRDAGIETETVISSGSPVRELSEIAKAHGADLVVLGSRYHSTLQTAMFGSTADALLDRVPASVFIARTKPPATRVLAATDGSHAAYRAVAYALQEASDAQADLTVIHVLDYPKDSVLPQSGHLRDVIGRMQLATPPHVSYQLDAGRPAERIVAKAREMDAGLVVVGSRGLGRLKGWLTGSVSRRVAASAPTSVLVVKDPPE